MNESMAEINTKIQNVIHQQSVLNSSNKIWMISDISDLSVDHLKNIEQVRFNVKSVALDIDAGDIGGSCYRIYKTAFNRTPDEGGLGYWIKKWI